MLYYGIRSSLQNRDSSFTIIPCVSIANDYFSNSSATILCGYHIHLCDFPIILRATYLVFSFINHEVG